VIANNIRIQFNERESPEIVLSIVGLKNEIMSDVSIMKKIIENKKLLSITIKQHREKRSLDANNCLWAVLTNMAAVLHTTKDELYLIMLKRYGQFTYVIVKNEAVEMFTRSYRLTEEKGKTKDGTGTQLLCYFGSSEYNTLQMSRLLDGVIQEAHEIGVETPTRSEIELMKSQWK